MDFSKRRLSLLSTLIALLVGCSSMPANTPGIFRGLAETGSRDLPWEMGGEDGEMYLPDVFYADDAQNEQIMPTTMASGRHQIDRLIYPTIGNPHMFIRNRGKSLVFALRLEPEIINAMNPKIDGADNEHAALTFDATTGKELAFYLIKREGRNENSGKRTAVQAGAGGVYKIIPKSYEQYALKGVPQALRKRVTLKVSFDSDSLKNVPEGLYDIRFEAKSGAGLTALNGESIYEFQYNSVRIFDKLDAKYKILNITDSQISVGMMKIKTLNKIQEFVKYLNASRDPEVMSTAFITFNGDLHNGGSPEMLSAAAVAENYRKEAHTILDALKELNYPIFLTAGNHDGYVAIGQPPAPIATEAGLKAAIDAAPSSEWPGYNWNDYQKFLRDTVDTKGGRHVDIFDGQFIRREGEQTFAGSYLPIAKEQRNYVLYDGFYQWRRTYGPLYSSWTFGDNFFVNLNSYDLRQHRRSGWGMYTVNYGGGLSPVQQVWMHRTLKRAQEGNKDIVVIAHHDPRGGHNGKDYPFYFEQIEFAGFGQSAQNYVQGELLNPIACKKVPNWIQSEKMSLGCLHDGLQEWMRADSEFDCDNSLRKDDGTCDTSKMDPKSADKTRRHPYYSGYNFLNMLARTPNLRTLLLGHTHYYSIDILQEGDELVPGSVILDHESQMKFAQQDVTNPLRGFSRWILGKGRDGEKTYDPNLLKSNGIEQSNDRWVLHFNSASGHTFERIIQGSKRELTILRLTAAAELTSQKYKGANNFGFSQFDIYSKADARGYDRPQINRIKSYINDRGRFSLTSDLVLDRTKRLSHGESTNYFNTIFSN